MSLADAPLMAADEMRESDSPGAKEKLMNGCKDLLWPRDWPSDAVWWNSGRKLFNVSLQRKPSSFLQMKQVQIIDFSPASLAERHGRGASPALTGLAGLQRRLLSRGQV
jgi:hypothetical protein